MRYNDKRDYYQVSFYDQSANTTTQRSVSAADDMFSDTFAANDRYQFVTNNNASGASQYKGFDKLYLSIDVALAGTGVTGKWQVNSKIGTTTTLRDIPTGSITDATNGLTTTGTNLEVSFDLTDPIFGVGFTYICYTITAVTSPSEGGHLSAKPQCGDNTLYIENGDTKTPADVHTASVAGGWKITEYHGSGNDSTTNNMRISAHICVESGGTFNVQRTNLENFIRCQGRPIYGIWGTGGTFNLGAKNTGQYYGSSLVQSAESATDAGFDFTNVIFNAYNSLIKFNSGSERKYCGFNANSTLENCVVEAWRPSISGGTISNVTFYGTDYLNLALGTYYDVTCSQQFTGIQSIRTYYVTPIILYRYDGNVYQCRESIWHLRDSTIRNTISATSFSVYGEIFEQKTVNIKVVDVDGNPISGATVLCRNNDGTTAFTTTTDANGVITEQNLTTIKHVGPTYVKTEYGPFDFVISKTGYRTNQIINYTPTDKINWTMELVAGDTVIYNSTIYSSTIY